MTSLLRPIISLPTLSLLAACGRTPDAEPSTGVAPVPVIVTMPGSTDTTAWVSATGTFASRDEIPLAFKIGGVVARVLVDEGATVQRGQLLAALDLREIDAAVAKAQVALDKAQRDHARVERLAADSVATLANLQDATSALDAARADLATMRMNRDYAVITAPEAGVVLSRHLTAGSTVGPGTPVMTLGGSRRGRVLRAGLPDRDALRVTVGDAATVTFDALTGARFEGTVILVGRAADPRTGTFAVEVVLENTDALPSGLVGQMRIAVKQPRTALTVPVAALLEAHGDSATLYTVESSRHGVMRAIAHRVQVGAIEGDHVMVSGIGASARIITQGAALVSAGDMVRVVTPATLDSASRGAKQVTTAALPGGFDR